MPDPLKCAEQHIRAFIAQSKVPEDPAHAENTVEWLLRMAPDADPALCLAALGHDIDRAAPDRVRREDFHDYDSFKAAHARHGAQILDRLLRDCGIGDELRNEVCRLVRLHETGGDERADLLRDADSLSYFDTNLPLYYRREGYQETLRRCIWGAGRLSVRGTGLLSQCHWNDPILEEIVHKALQTLSD